MAHTERVKEWNVEAVQKWLLRLGGAYTELVPKFNVVTGRLLLELKEKDLQSAEFGLDAHVAECVVDEIADLCRYGTHIGSNSKKHKHSGAGNDSKDDNPAPSKRHKKKHGDGGDDDDDDDAKDDRCQVATCGRHFFKSELRDLYCTKEGCGTIITICRFCNGNQCCSKCQRLRCAAHRDVGADCAHCLEVEAGKWLGVRQFALPMCIRCHTDPPIGCDSKAAPHAELCIECLPVAQALPPLEVKDNAICDDKHRPQQSCAFPGCGQYVQARCGVCAHARVCDTCRGVFCTDHIRRCKGMVCHQMICGKCSVAKATREFFCKACARPEHLCALTSAAKMEEEEEEEEEDEGALPPRSESAEF